MEIFRESAGMSSFSGEVNILSEDFLAENYKSARWIPASLLDTTYVIMSS